MKDMAGGAWVVTAREQSGIDCSPLTPGDIEMSFVGQEHIEPYYDILRYGCTWNDRGEKSYTTFRVYCVEQEYEEAVKVYNDLYDSII